MTPQLPDSLSRLADANPVTVDDHSGQTASAQAVLATILAGEHPAERRLVMPPPARHRGRRRAARWLTPVALAAVVVAALLVLTTGGAAPSVVARVYAAIRTDGVIVHYIETFQSRDATGTHRLSTTEVWAAGSRRHLIISFRRQPGQAKGDGLLTEVTSNGGHGERYSDGAGGTIGKLTLPAALTSDCRSTAGLNPSCVLSNGSDPLAVLRRLYRSGRLHAAGQTTLDGHRVDVIATRGATPRTTGQTILPRVRALVDPRTFVPISIQETFVFTPPRVTRVPPTTLTTTITDYQRLALTPHNRQLLAMRPHPHARIERGVTRVTETPTTSTSSTTTTTTTTTK